MAKQIKLNKEVDFTYDEFKDSLGYVFITVPEKDREKAIRKEYENLTGKDPERSIGQVSRYSKKKKSDEA